MTLREAIEEVKLFSGDNMDGNPFDFVEVQYMVKSRAGYATAIATILNAVVKGELRHQVNLLSDLCDEGFASVPFTIMPPKPELYNAKPHHAYKATCHETGNVYYGVTDGEGYAELKLSAADSVKGELK